MRWLDSITDAMNMNLGRLWEMVRDVEAWLAAVHGLETVGHNWATKQQQQQLLLGESHGWGNLTGYSP